MFTQFDKTIATAIMAVFVIASALLGKDLTPYANELTTILVVAMPVIVFFVPNLTKLEDGSFGSATPEQPIPAAPIAPTPVSNQDADSKA